MAQITNPKSPIEPKLFGDALSRVRSSTPATLINARSGLNASAIGLIVHRIEPRLDLLGKCAGGSTASWDAITGREAAFSASRAYPPAGASRFHTTLGAATDTKLQHHSCSNLIIDHAPDEIDPVAMCAEIERVLKPGGRLVLIGYDAPWLDDPDVHQLVRVLLSETARHANGLEAMMGDDFAGLELPVNRLDRSRGSLKAEADCTLVEFVDYLRARPSVAAFEASEGFHVMGEYISELGRRWGPAKRRRHVVFEVKLLIGERPLDDASTGRHEIVTARDWLPIPS